MKRRSFRKRFNSFRGRRRRTSTRRKSKTRFYKIPRGGFRL